MTIPHQLKVLFSAFPPQAGDVETQIMAYGIALDGYDPRDIEAGIRRFLRGEVADHNPSFAPSPALLGKAVRKCMDDRLDSERRSNPPLMLDRQDVVKSLPENQRRDFVKAQLARAGLDAPDLRTPEAIAAARKRERERLAREDAMMGADLSPGAMAKRLGFSAGDPDGDEAAA